MNKKFIHTLIALMFTASLFFLIGQHYASNKAEKQLKESIKLTKKAQERSIKALQIAKYYKERCENDNMQYAQSNHNDHNPL